MRPAIKLICPNGCQAHQDRHVDIEKKMIVGNCRKCNAQSVEPSDN